MPVRLVLSMWEPWAICTVVVDPLTGRPPKGIESRHFVPNIPPPFDVVIHATKTWNRLIADFVKKPFITDALQSIGYLAADPRPFHAHPDVVPPRGATPIPLGALVGIATVTRIVPAAELLDEWHRMAHERWRREFHLGDYRPGRFGWVLERAAALPEPIPFIGQQTVLYPLPGHYNDQIDVQLYPTDMALGR